MLSSFSFKVLLVVTIFISSGSTFITGSDKKKRVSFLDSETKSKDDLVDESKKPVIIGLKRASDDVEGLSKFLSQLSEIKNPEPKDYHAKNCLDFLHISHTEFPQILYSQKGKLLQNSEYVFYPFKNVYLKDLEEPLNLNSIAIKVYDPSIREKMDDTNVKDVQVSNKMKFDLENKSNEIMKNNNPINKLLPIRGKSNKSASIKSKASLAVEMLSSTESSTVFENSLNVSNKESPLTLNSSNTLAIDSVSRMMKNFMFEKTRSASTTCKMCTNLSNLSLVFSSNISSTTENPPTDLSTILTTEPTSQRSHKAQQNFILKENLDSKNPVNLQITLTLRINNGSTNILPLE